MRVRLVLLAVALAALAAFAVERLVVTDREAIASLLEDAGDAVERRDFAAFARAIDESYAGQGRDKAGLVAYVRSARELVPVSGIDVDVSEVTIDGERAATRVVVRPGALGIEISGRVDLLRTDAGWRVTGATEEETRRRGR